MSNNEIKGYITDIEATPYFYPIGLFFRSTLGTINTNCELNIEIQVADADEIAMYGWNLPTSKTVTQVISQMQSDITDLKADVSLDADAFPYRDIVSQQYITMPAEPVSYTDYRYLEKKIDSIPDGKHLCFVTDTHWGDDVYDANNQNEKGSNKLIQYIRKRKQIKTVVFGGDSINTYARTGIAGAKQNREYIGQAVSMFGSDFLTVFGNHDSGVVTATGDQAAVRFIPWNVNVPIFTGHLKDVVTEDRTDIFEQFTDITAGDVQELVIHDKLHYYKDDAANSIRYIVLDTGGGESNVLYNYLGTSGTGIIPLQLTFLYNALMTTPAGYDVIVCTHYCKHSPEVGNLIKSLSYVARMLSAYKLKTTVTIDTSGDNMNSNFELIWSNSEHVMDFSEAPDTGKVFMLTGHTHQDYLMVWKADSEYGTSPAKDVTWDGITPVDPSAGDILIVCTTTDNMHREEFNGYTRTAGTTTDQAFDIVTVNDDGITLTRIGVGNDRVIPFA